MEDEMKFRHPSYGQVSVHRQTGSNLGLFGSDITHDTTIRFTVSKSELTREYSEDKYFPYETIVEFDVSPAQFTELLTTMNTSGVPCTIRRTGKEYIDYKPPYEQGKYEVMSNELKSEVNNIAKLTKQLSVILDGLDTKEKMPEVTKKNLKAINSKLKSAATSNLPFVMKQVRQELDNTVSDALAAIEQKKIARLEGLFEQKKLGEVNE